MFISNKVGYLQDWITQIWVKLTGRLIQRGHWLIGPIGDTKVIGETFIRMLAQKENLHIIETNAGTGLLESIDLLELTHQEKHLLHPRVAQFYEQTSQYDLDIWSEWCGFFRPFGWLLSVIFSKRSIEYSLKHHPLILRPLCVLQKPVN